MELVEEHSEEQLMDLLAIIEKDPGDWVSVHINVSRLSEQALEREALSAHMLEDIQQSGMRVAKMLMDSRLSGFEGKTFIFEDSDVIALFKKGATPYTEVLEKLRREFTRTGLIDILTISDMKERLESLVRFSREKLKTAEIFRQRQQAVGIADSIFIWKVGDMALTRGIQEKRKSRDKGIVLIIEDDVVARGMVALMLRDQYDVIQAKDAKSGIVAYIDKAPNVVFLDIHLPDHNGHEVLNRLKLLDPASYVLMLSGDSVPENVFMAKHSGAAGFIRKPFLKQHIMKYMDNCPTLAKQ